MNGIKKVAKAYRLSKEQTHTTTMSSRDIINDFDDDQLLTDYVLQRRSGQWDIKTRSGFIGAMIKREAIPALTICQEAGTKSKWLADGLQRITTLIDYTRNKFKLAAGIERPIIEYRDRSGEAPQWTEYDLRNKYYKDLPTELQELIMSYTYQVVLYPDCSPDDIGYYIRQINHQRSMTANQKALTYIDKYAPAIRSIADSSFWDYAPISAREKVNGGAERAIIEAVMLTCYPAEWIKKPEDMASRLNAIGSDKDFETVESLCEELAENLTSDALEVFTVKDAALWIATYAAYRDYKTGDEDPEKFANFIDAFVNGDLHGKKVSGVPGVEGGIASYDDLLDLSKATKDKIVVTRKAYVLKALMMDFFGIVDQPEPVEEEINTTAEEPAVAEIQEEENIEHHDDSIIPAEVATDVELSSALAAMTKDTYIATNAALTAGDAWWITNQIYPGDDIKGSISDASLLMATLDDWCTAIPDDSWLLDLKYLIQCIKFADEISQSYFDDDDALMDLFGKVAETDPEDYTGKGSLYAYLMAEYSKISADEKTA